MVGPQMRDPGVKIYSTALGAADPYVGHITATHSSRTIWHGTLCSRVGGQNGFNSISCARSQGIRKEKITIFSTGCCAIACTRHNIDSNLLNNLLTIRILGERKQESSEQGGRPGRRVRQSEQPVTFVEVQGNGFASICYAAHRTSDSVHF